MSKIDIDKVIEDIEKYKQDIVKDYYNKKDKTEKHYLNLYAIGAVNYLLRHFKELNNNAENKG